ncbi:hypothetical protein I4F81_003955 [Pyropia yezoensis]|uniref:Uncharacterized protein n=1 Tax=Pyropia yezoensis TaxID=2788 RepID=A0ACC3BUK3_PYRYE|nr:hypothetical protein I4F81_003955 [Neopyropia yezoensis]
MPPTDDGAAAADAPASTPRSRRPHWLPVDMITEPHGEALYGVSFSPLARSSADYPVLATCGGPSVRVYAATPAKTRLLQAYLDEDNTEAYYAVGWTYNADGRGSHWVVVGGRKGILRVIDVTGRSGVAALAGHGEAINDVAVHPSDPALVLTASRDESLRLWNVRSRSCVAIFGGEGGHRGDVLYCAWDTFGNRFASTGHDNSFPLFSSRRIHRHYVDCAAFIGDLILSKSNDERLVLWRPGTVAPSASAGVVAAEARGTSVRGVVRHAV